MRSWTSIVVAICVALMTFFSFFLYRELTRSIDKTGGEVIGTITFKKRSASRRFTENVIWEEIEQESEIFNYDAVRTLEYSSAVIALKDGTKIELDQNTLMVVILSEKGLNINFDRGGISAESGSGATGPIILNSKDAAIAFDKGGVSVNSDGDGMNIQVSSGSAKISSEGKEINISSEQITTLKNGVAEIKKTALFPEFPAHNSYLVTANKYLQINFSWRSDPPGEVRVEISTEIQFRNIIKSYKSLKSVLAVNLSAGDYYWRLVRSNGASSPVKFTILSDREPKLITPGMNRKLSVTENMEYITFRWEKTQYASAYRITVARDRKMSDIVLNLESKINTISTAELEPGGYYWTVKSIYPQGMLADLSSPPPNFFELEKLKISQVKPVPLDPGPLTTASPFSLNWKGVYGSKSYNVDLAEDADFRDIILREKTSNTFVKIDRKLPEGKYFWRVSAIIGEKKSATSDTAVLTLMKPVQIVALNPPSGAVISDKPETITFSWRDPNNGEKYRIEISDGTDFRNIIQSADSVVSAADLKRPAEGYYFWRVILKDKTGNTIAQSAVSEFTIPGDLKSPVQIIPKANEKLIPGFTKRLRFEWSRIAGADEYEMEIFQRIAGIEKPMLIYSSKVNYIELSNQSVFKPGIYSWIVRAKQLKKGRVTAYRESEKSYFEIETVELLPAPVVRKPDVIFN